MRYTTLFVVLVLVTLTLTGCGALAGRLPQAAPTLASSAGAPPANAAGGDDVSAAATAMAGAGLVLPTVPPAEATAMAASAATGEAVPPVPTLAVAPAEPVARRELSRAECEKFVRVPLPAPAQVAGEASAGVVTVVARFELPAGAFEKLVRDLGSQKEILPGYSPFLVKDAPVAAAANWWQPPTLDAVMGTATVTGVDDIVQNVYYLLAAVGPADGSVTVYLQAQSF